MYYLISYTLLHVLYAQFHQKQLLITDFAIIAKGGLSSPRIVTSSLLICDVTRTWGTGIVTSYSSIACANWRRDDFHKLITTVNIDSSPHSIHGSACKK